MCLTPEHTQGSESPQSGALIPLSPHARSRRRGGSLVRAALGSGCPRLGLSSARLSARAGSAVAACRRWRARTPRWRHFGVAAAAAAAAPCPVPRSGSLPFPPLRPAGGTMSVVEHVREMAAAGLHSNVRLLSGLLLTMSGNNP